MTLLLINCFLITSRWPHWNGLMVYMEFNHAQFLYWTLAINIHIGYVRKKRSISSIGSINKGGNLVYTRCEKEVYNVCLTFPIFCSFERSCCSAAYLSTASSSGLSSISSSLRVGRIHFTRGRFPRSFHLCLTVISDEVFLPFLFGVGKLQSKFGKVLFDPL